MVNWGGTVNQGRRNPPECLSDSIQGLHSAQRRRGNKQPSLCGGFPERLHSLERWKHLRTETTKAQSILLMRTRWSALKFRNLLLNNGEKYVYLHQNLMQPEGIVLIGNLFPQIA
jgi:hypothetical protein